jgi:predicted ATP-dependent endonuclease of OLD family
VHDKFSKLQQNTTNQKIEINIKAYRFADKEKALSNIFNQEADEFTKAYKKRKEYDNSNSFIEKFKKCIGKLLPGVDILQDDSNKLLFRKNGIDSEYKDLSSGELAIINKFAELLININFLKDSIVLVDEPEEHLHQELSENILSDIKSIITDKDGMQLSQLFVATQSDFVVQQALENTEKNLIYILERDSSNVIFKRYDEIKILSQPTTSEIR